MQRLLPPCLLSSLIISLSVVIWQKSWNAPLISPLADVDPRQADFDQSQPEIALSLQTGVNVTNAPNPEIGRVVDSGSIANATLNDIQSRHAAPFDITAMRCPRVFMYELPLFKGDMKPHAITADMSFGPVMAPGIYKTNQYNAAFIFINRLTRSLHCPLTSNPEEADLFLITSMSAPKGSSEWGSVCKKSLIHSQNAATYFPYLNETTASRHMVIISKGHYNAGGAGCSWLQGDIAPFKQVQRFAYSHTYAESRFGVRNQADAKSSQLDGRVVSIPYPTSVHWNSQIGPEKFWAQTAPRKLLISICFQFHGKQADLRKKLFADCQQLGASICKAEQEYDPLPVWLTKTTLYSAWSLRVTAPSASPSTTASSVAASPCCSL